MKNIWIFLLVLPFLGFSQQNDTIPKKKENQLEEVVISGTLKAVKRLENPVPVEIITATFLKQNPTSNVFDALQNVNGLRPQNNCNVCNTGDIRINGLDGPYTMVTIDGMPIVSALGSVYGLSGIPNSMIEKIEVVKGATSTLYGSEAVGGLINIITKDAATSENGDVEAVEGPKMDENGDSKEFSQSQDESALDSSGKAGLLQAKRRGRGASGSPMDTVNANGISSMDALKTSKRQKRPGNAVGT